ncbi:MAG: ABC transporter permease [Dehalococcoidales bacterium]|nr:ABC transporter permease [Dehalococcoidales bacterium]
MQTYIIRRVWLAFITIGLVAIIIFLLLRFIPGSVLDLMVAELAEETGTVDLDIEGLKHLLGLDVPVYAQFGRWIGFWPQDSGAFYGIIQGNWGTSLWSGESIIQMMLHRIPVSIELALLGMTLAWFIGLPIGIWSAIRQDTAIDFGGRSFTIFWLAAPGFWIGTMVIVYPSILWGWTPPIEYIPLVKDPIGNIGQFLIPAFLTGAATSASISRYSRTWMLEVLRQDYIRTAWAKGLQERTVILRHALRNALIPLITVFGRELSRLITGVVIMEQIFVLPGMGRLFLNALNTRDYPVVQAVNLLTSTWGVFLNLIIDITYAYIDPRIRYR